MSWILLKFNYNSNLLKLPRFNGGGGTTIPWDFGSIYFILFYLFMHTVHRKQKSEDSIIFLNRINIESEMKKIIIVHNRIAT